MSVFTPPGYSSCHDALNSLWREVHRIPTNGLRPNEWRCMSLGKYSRGNRLQPSTHDRAEKVVHCLQGKLCEGKAVAWQSIGGRLVELDREEFSSQDATRWLQDGENHNGPIFISDRKAEDVKANCSDLVKESPSLPSYPEPKKPGAKNKSRDAALVYWGMFPKGHGAANLQWAQAEDSVNEQLKNLGLTKVQRTAMREAINQIGHVDPTTGAPKSK